MNTKQINLRYFMLLLTMILYPVLPVYFRLTGSSLMMYYIVLVAALICLFLGKIYNVFKIRYIIPYILISLVPFIYHGEWNELVKLFIAPIGLFALMLTLINNKKKFLQVIDILIITGGIVGIFGIVEEVTSVNIFAFLNNSGADLSRSAELIHRMGLLRIQQSFGMSTNYCNYLIIITSLVCYRIYTEGCKHRKLFKVIWWLLLLNAFLTGSRAPLIVIIIVQIIILVKTGRKESLKQGLKISLVLVAVCVVGAVLGLPVFSYIRNYFYVLLSLINSSFQAKITAEFGSNLSVSSDRMNLYLWVYNDVKNKLLLGLGDTAAGNFSIQVNQWRTKSSVENDYLATLLKYGFVGLVSQFWFFLGNLKTSINAIKNELSSEKVGFNLIFILTFIGYIVNLFTVSMQADERIFFVFIGLMLVYNLRILPNKIRERTATRLEK